MPRVSVIMAVYNCESYLAQTLDSVLAQTFTDWECIIVDDASTDGTAAVGQAYAARDSRFKVHVQDRATKKPYPANRNVGLELATGTWVAPLDGDDWWEPWKLEKQLAAVEARPGMVACLGAAWIWSDGKIVGKIETYPTNEIERMLSIKNITAHSAILLNRQAVLDVGSYDDRHPFGEDWDLWLRLMWRYGAQNIASLNEPVIYYRWHANNISKDLKTNSYEWMIVRRILRHAGWGLKQPLLAWRVLNHWLLHDIDVFRHAHRYDIAQKRTLWSLLLHPASRWRWQQLFRVRREWRDHARTAV